MMFRLPHERQTMINRMSPRVTAKGRRSPSRIRSVLIVALATILMVVGCVHHPTYDPSKNTVGQVVCLPYSGSNTDIVHVIALYWPHISPGRGTYYTFHYDKNAPTNPACLSLDFGKLCKCDIVSQKAVSPPMPCFHGETKDVTEFVFRRGAIITEPTTECPDRKH